uniref:NADH dehydrogenase subunit 4 n=1 Tax=Tyrophagus longior TaxID=223634 RepID=A0A0S2SXI5_TYRLO|nr:NADH dehydrogenase subunit 4 [Tyrophagus longior]ALP46620.1 NADH dehydrogenase subunit 4 [Tyrophagus longior]
MKMVVSVFCLLIAFYVFLDFFVFNWIFLLMVFVIFNFYGGFIDGFMYWDYFSFLLIFVTFWVFLFSILSMTLSNPNFVMLWIMLFFLFFSFFTFNSLFFYYFFEFVFVLMFSFLLGWGKTLERLQASLLYVLLDYGFFFAFSSFVDLSKFLNFKCFLFFNFFLMWWLSYLYWFFLIFYVLCFCCWTSSFWVSSLDTLGSCGSSCFWFYDFGWGFTKIGGLRYFSIFLFCGVLQFFKYIVILLYFLCRTLRGCVCKLDLYSSNSPYNTHCLLLCGSHESYILSVFEFFYLSHLRFSYYNNSSWLYFPYDILSDNLCLWNEPLSYYYSIYGCVNSLSFILYFMIYVLFLKFKCSSFCVFLFWGDYFWFVAFFWSIWVSYNYFLLFFYWGMLYLYLCGNSPRFFSLWFVLFLRFLNNLNFRLSLYFCHFLPGFLFFA